MRKEPENNKEYKRHLAHRGKIKCDYCRYNRGENLKKSDRKCWKHRTKARKQWEVGSKKSKELYDWVWPEDQTWRKHHPDYMHWSQTWYTKEIKYVDKTEILTYDRNKGKWTK